MGVRENIIRLRDLTGITQEQLGEIADVSRSAVSLWEIGDSKPRMGAVQKIADHFGLKKSNIIEDGGMDCISVSLSGRLYEVEDDSTHLTDKEKYLVDLFRMCSAQGREYLIGVAQVTAGLFGRDA
jgi:transcriptional regulator with XRE-family HTH domain